MAFVNNAYVYYGSDSTEINYNQGSPAIIKYTPYFDSVIWIKRIANAQQAAFIITTIRGGKNDDNLYLACNMRGGVDVEIEDTTYNHSEVSTYKGFLIILSANGDMIHRGFVNQNMKQGDFLSDIEATDTNKIFICGLVRDTFFRNNQQFYTSPPLPPDITPTVLETSAYLFIGRISTQSADWIKLTAKSIAATNLITGSQQRLGTDPFDNIYMSFLNRYNYSVSIGGLSDSSVQSSPFVFSKFDSLGNALWLKSGVTAIDMQPNSRSELVYCGRYNGQLELAPFVLNSQYHSGFIAKITNYSITRGEVHAGPYCAGDTFYVPYTKEGEYDTANWFIAELSDENGNFEGAERELGRLKGTEDSTIIGQLPLFEVVSSGNYRIRVRSTHPPVQSFYRLDSLRLLIYSRDKVDPGLPETVCYGDSLQLHTFGGTAWQWSPAYNMDDSTSRTPFILPDKDTVYRIVISDSSGCGEADTAYKQIYVRSHPQLSALNFADDCLSSSVHLAASFSGGDTSGYRWTWYNRNDFDNWQELHADSFALGDSVSLPYPLTTDSIHIVIVLEDGCSVLKDTAYLTIPPFTPLQITVSVYDTLLCSGQELSLTTTGEGGVAEKYQWTWIDSDTGEEISDTDSLSLAVQTDRTFGVLLTDGCMDRNDTAEVVVRVRPHLQTNILDRFQSPAMDTTVCYGSKLEFTATGEGGDSANYTFEWYLNDSLIASSDTLSELVITEPSTLTLILQDGCTIEPDTQHILINVLPPPEVTFSAPDTLCLGEEILLSAQGTGGVFGKYQFTWLHKKEDGSFENLGSANSIKLNTKNLVVGKDFSKSNSIEILLVLTDNCSSPNDTFSKKIIIRPELSLSLSSSTLCANPNALITANPKGGNSASYQVFWYDENGDFIGDGLTQTVTPLGFDKFKAVLKDACSSDSAQAEIKIDRVPNVLTLNSDPNSGCQPLPITFEPQTDYKGKHRFILNFGNEDSVITQEGALNLEYKYQASGTFVPRLSITTEGGCQKPVLVAPITVFPKPKADFTFEPEEPDMDNPFVRFINQSSGAQSFLWSIDPYGDFVQQNPEVEYKDTGYHRVRLIAVSEHNCQDTAQSTIYIKTNYRVFLPSAFSPNGDGLNDTFKPSVRGFSELDFRVYNRWGELIFHSTKDEAWDGTYNTLPMPEGVYAFTLRVVNVYGKMQTFKGTVTLMR